MSSSRAQMGDAIVGSGTFASNPQENWARHQLLGNQLNTMPEGWEGGEETWKIVKNKILGMRSEEDNIRLHVMAKLADVKESTCEWDSCVALCGGETDRFKQADIIAASIWEKELAARKLAVFAPNKEVLHTLYNNSNTRALEVRSNGGKDFAVRSALSKNFEGIKKVLGVDYIA